VLDEGSRKITCKWKRRYYYERCRLGVLNEATLTIVKRTWLYRTTKHQKCCLLFHAFVIVNYFVITILDCELNLGSVWIKQFMKCDKTLHCHLLLSARKRKKLSATLLIASLKKDFCSWASNYMYIYQNFTFNLNTLTQHCFNLSTTYILQIPVLDAWFYKT